MNKNISFINQMEPWYDESEINAIVDYMRGGGWIMEFKKTKELEEMIASYVGAKHCCILPNGTLTLWAALAILGIGRGDEVIVPDFTMVATPNAVKLAGAEPIFVDVDPKNICLDIRKTEAAITKKTKAIMLVSINGRSPDMQSFLNLAQKYNLYLVEDAAQSLGSKHNDKYLGTWGIFGSYSFSMPKIITMGQGGALVTDNTELYQKLVKFKDFGRIRGGADEYEMLGYNLKFSDLQAVFGIEQMKKIDWRINRKKEIYKLFTKELKGVKQVEMLTTDLESVVPWFNDIFVDDPDKLSLYLKDKNIGTRKVYPTLHDLPFYNFKGDFQGSTKISSRGLWLPSSSKLKDDEVIYICNSIKEYYEDKE